MSDKELIYNVKRAMEHDEEAIAALYNYTYASAYSMLSRLCKDETAVEDILQESYIAAFSRLKNLSDGRSFARWFKGIVLNKWRDYSKDKSLAYNTVIYEIAELDFDNDQLEPSAHEVVEKADTDDEIWSAVNELPENQRICMILFYYEEMKIEDIAEVLDIPVGSVKSRLHYGRERLKKKITERDLLAACSIPITGDTVIRSEIFNRVMTALAESSGASVVSAGLKAAGSGLLLKLCIGAASALAVGGIVFAAWNFARASEPDMSAAAPLNASATQSKVTVATTAVTTSATDAADTTTSAVTTSTTANTTTSAVTTSTTTAPQLFGSFDYSEVSGGVAITKYTGNETDVVIPSELGGKPVVKIANNAFNHCQTLRSVTIPSSVTEIGNNAFRECDALRSVSLGGGVRRIGDMAFGGCDSLTSVYVPSGVQYIGIYAFAYCNSLESVTIDEGTQTMMYCVFYKCTSLRRVKLPASLASIGADVFKDTPADLTLCVKQGTYAYDYAVEHGYSAELYN